MPEELMLSEVWGQEPQLRHDTIEWLYSFQLSAYSGLADATSRPIPRFPRRRRAQALNAALFAAFDEVFSQLSYELGEAAARVHRGRGRLDGRGVALTLRALTWARLLRQTAASASGRFGHGCGYQT
jgi:hypothetical protein